MALLWLDGFETYDSYQDALNYNLGYTRNGDAIVGSYDRTGGKGVQCGYEDWLRKTIDETPQTIIFGAALYINHTATPTQSNVANRTVYRLSAGGTVHLYFQVTAGRLLQVKDSAWGVIGTTSGHSLAGQTWYYIEVKATISNTVGQVTINVDGVQRLSTSADKDTQNGASAYANQVYLGQCFNFNTWHDDFYICDTTGSAPQNAMLGDCRIDVIRPTGSGETTQFTPSAGANWENVDDSYGPDDDSTYNDGGSGEKDTYQMGDVSLSGTIFGVRMM
jgi:hypothetical protein